MPIEQYALVTTPLIKQLTIILNLVYLLSNRHVQVVTSIVGKLASYVFRILVNSFKMLGGWFTGLT